MKRLYSAVALLLVCGAAWAQQYPAKPIRLVVPFPPSGAADLAARVVATPLGQLLGQPVVLDNKAGGDGVIAGNEVRKAAPDGYTLLFGTNTGMCAAPAMHRNPAYDPIADFTPVAMVGKFGFFVFTNAAVPAKNMAELIAYVRQNPGKLNYGSGNSTSIFTTASLAQAEHLDMQHIPYKGDAPATADLLANRIQVLIGTPGTMIGHVKEGKARALATLLPSRSPLLPDAPTLTEAGLKPVAVQPYAGIYGPPGLPREIVDKLASAVQATMARQEVKDGVAKFAFEAQSSTPAELLEFHKVQLEIWKKSARELNLISD